jgi:1,2-phenylacetyl-CoA epoxidase catalytic subunit
LLFLACGLVFQTAFIFAQLPRKESFYLQYHDAMARAIQERNYHILGERRPGSFY